VFDNLSSELQNKYISVLCKQNRHYKAKVIISSQYYNNITKQTRQQIDYILLFPKIPIERLEIIYLELDLNILYETFLKCYRYATKDKYNFLYIDIQNESCEKISTKNSLLKICEVII
jgi:hypothetical protein